LDRAKDEFNWYFLHLFYFILPFIDAVRVQLYKIANSPNTRPGPIVVNTFVCLLTSTVPSVKTKKNGLFKIKF